MSSNSNSSLDAEWKIVALAIIQSLGVTFALILHLISWFLCSIDTWTFCALAILLAGLILLSVTVALDAAPVRAGLRKLLTLISAPATKLFLQSTLVKAVLNRWQSSRDGDVRLANTIHLLATADLIAITICLINTGGGERSLFGPFLFIIPPIIILFKTLGNKAIVCYGLAAVLIFAISLCPDISHFISLTAADYKRNRGYGVLIVIATAISTMLPIIFAMCDPDNPKDESEAASEKTVRPT